MSIFLFNILILIKIWVQGDKLPGNPGDGRNGSARKRKSGVGSSEQEGAQYNSVISRWKKVKHLEDLSSKAFSFDCRLLRII
jgi:hypothetical protein